MPNYNPLNVVLEALQAAGCEPQRNGSGYRALCPAHEDRKPSLTVGMGSDGRVLVKCHAGCPIEEVCDALGLAPRDLFPPKDDRKPSPRPGRPAGFKPTGGNQTFATYEQALAALESKLGERSKIWGYHDRNGELVGVVARWDGPNGKDIRPVSRLADGRWVIGAMPNPRPLYDLPAVLALPEEPVFVTEGEKCATALSRLGLIATTSAGGAKAAAKTDWSPLRGRRCVIIPDYDSAGFSYSQDVARLVAAAGGETRTLKLWEFCPGLPPGGDVADILADPNWCGLGLGDAATPADFAAWLRAQAEALFANPRAEADQADSLELVQRPPFPTEALPEVLREYVENVAAAIGCDVSYVAVPALVACGAAIGNTRRLVPKQGWFVPPILWGVLVGESGTYKSPALRAVMQPLKRIQDRHFKEHEEQVRRYNADLAKWDQEAKEAKKAGKPAPERPALEPPVRRIAVDATLEAITLLLSQNPRGLLLARDELAGWIKSFDRYVKHGGSDEAHWLSIYHADTIIVDRKTGEQRTIRVPRAAVSIVGGIQPGVLKRVLNSQHRDSGLAARLLMVYPPRKPRRWTDNEINPAVAERFERLVESLYAIPLNLDCDGVAKPENVKLTAGACREFRRFHDDNATEQVDLEGDLCAAWSKFEELAARLSLILYYVQVVDEDRPDDLLVDAEAMRAAIALTQWFKQEAKRVYGVLGETEPESNERKLLEFLQRRGGTATARDVQRGCRWLREPGKAEEALEALSKRGLGRWEPFATSPRGGQPVRRFALLTVDRVSTEPPSVSTEPSETSVLRGTVDCRRVDNSSVQFSSATLGERAEPSVGTWSEPAEEPAGRDISPPGRDGGEPGGGEAPFRLDNNGFNAEPWFGFI